MELYYKVDKSFDVIRLAPLINKLYNYKFKIRLPY